MPNSDFTHLYWMGGSPCGAKSSVAQIIADQYKLNIYSIDGHLDRLMRQITPEAQPALSQWESQTWEERWMQPVDELLKFVIDAYNEEFHLCMEEIKAIPTSQPTIIEGNPLRPEMVIPLMADKNHAIWLIAKDEDLKHYYSQREWARHVVKETSNPELAFNNWTDRDIAFANLIRKSCETNHLTYLMSNRQLSLEEKAQQAAKHFRLVS